MQTLVTGAIQALVRAWPTARGARRVARLALWRASARARLAGVKILVDSTVVSGRALLALGRRRGGGITLTNDVKSGLARLNAVCADAVLGVCAVRNKVLTGNTRSTLFAFGKLCAVCTTALTIKVEALLALAHTGAALWTGGLHAGGALAIEVLGASSAVAVRCARSALAVAACLTGRRDVGAWLTWGAVLAFAVRSTAAGAREKLAVWTGCATQRAHGIALACAWSRLEIAHCARGRAWQAEKTAATSCLRKVAVVAGAVRELRGARGAAGKGRAADAVKVALRRAGALRVLVGPAAALPALVSDGEGAVLVAAAGTRLAGQGACG